MARSALTGLSIGRWVFLSAALAALPLAIIVLLDDAHIYRGAVETAELACRSAVSTLAARQQGLAGETDRILGVLAAFPEVRRRDREASSALFARFVSEYTAYSALLADDLEGEVFASGIPFPNPAPVRDRKFFRDVVATRAAAVGEYVVSRSSGKAVLHFAHPILDEAGEFAGVIQAGYNLEHLDTLFAGIALPTGSVVLATDHAGVVLYRSSGGKDARGKKDDPAAFAKMTGAPSGTFYATGADGQRQLMAYQQLRLRPTASPYMYVRAEIPEAQIVATPRLMLARDLAILGFALMLALASAWYVANQLVARRLERISLAAARFAGGELAARSELPHDETEIGRLARAFDAMSAAVQDKTRRLEASEAERRAGEEFLATTLHSIGDAVVVTDDAGRIVRMNPVAEALSGCAAAAAQGRAAAEVLRLVESRTAQPVEDPVKQVLLRGRVVTLADDVDLIVSDQVRRKVSASAAPILSPGSPVPRGAVVVFRDVTERRRLREQVVQAQKMETVGRLAGGIAHDFNNLLVAILGGADLLARERSLDARLREVATGILEAATRAAELTRSLLAYARKAPGVAQTVDAHEAIAGAMRVLERTIDRSVVIEGSLGAERCGVRGDLAALQNVILNLGLNARDAMPAGGVFAVSTANVLLGAAQCAALGGGVAPGEYLEIVARDTGVGMSREAREHLFEPFYTTKASGQGTGLGLAAVYGTVQVYGGWIGVESEEGQGTRFRILLPVADVPLERGTAAPALPLERGSGRVLLVDDEPTVRGFAQAVIESLGYEVTAAADGETAVRLFGEAKGAFVAVVLDMVMPKMNGVATLEALRAIAPEVRAVLSSGYHDDSKVQDLLATGRVVFLAKPYSVAGLSAAVAEVVRRAAAGQAPPSDPAASL